MSSGYTCEASLGGQRGKRMQLGVHALLLLVVISAPMAYGERLLSAVWLSRLSQRLTTQPLPVSTGTYGPAHVAMKAQQASAAARQRALAAAIRLIPTEPNLRFGGDGNGASAHIVRVELLLNITTTASASGSGSSSGGSHGSGGLEAAEGSEAAAVWAPLCASTNDLVMALQDAEDGDTEGAWGRWQLDPVAHIACNQFRGMASFPFQRRSGFMRAPIPLPDVWVEATDGEEGPPLFSPRAHSHWVTVIAVGIRRGVSSLQELKLQVSTSRCDTGFLYQMECTTAAEPTP